MSDLITTFFDAWQLESDETRLETITRAVADDVQYDDPRTSETLRGIGALNDYVGMFSANAPGWTARVITTDTTAGMTRATVAFGGMGPDGKDMVCLLYTSPSPRDKRQSRMPSSA